MRPDVVYRSCVHLSDDIDNFDDLDDLDDHDFDQFDHNFNHLDDVDDFNNDDHGTTQHDDDHDHDRQESVRFPLRVRCDRWVQRSKRREHRPGHRCLHDLGTSSHQAGFGCPSTPRSAGGSATRKRIGGRPERPVEYGTAP